MVRICLNDAKVRNKLFIRRTDVQLEPSVRLQPRLASFRAVSCLRVRVLILGIPIIIDLWRICLFFISETRFLFRGRYRRRQRILLAFK